MAVLNEFGAPLEVAALAPAPAVGTDDATDLVLTGGAPGTGNAAGGDVNLVPTAGSGSGADGEVLINGSEAGFVIVQIPYFPTSASLGWFVAARAYRVKAVSLRPLVAGTDGGAVTATLYKAPSGTAIAAGTALLSATLNLKGTINENQAGALSAVTGAVEIAAGDAVGPVLAGVMTAALGVLTVTLVPI